MTKQETPVMSRHALHVTTAHLHELAGRHVQAAGEMTSATELASDVGSRIRQSHGVVTSSTASAVEIIQEVRRAAGHGIARDCRLLGDGLIAAARRYDDTDDASESSLRQQMRSDPPSPDLRPAR
jgi:hypothetical protein